jgi:hypothetical protein
MPMGEVDCVAALIVLISQAVDLVITVMTIVEGMCCLSYTKSIYLSIYHDSVTFKIKQSDLTPARAT